MMHATLRNLALVLTVSGLSGCGGPPREHHVEQTAQAACERFDECGPLADRGYGSFNECLSDLEGAFYDLWPEDRCGDGQIDRKAVQDCQARADVFPCDANAIDVLSYLQSCNADSVCTEPAN